MPTRPDIEATMASTVRLVRQCVSIWRNVKVIGVRVCSV
jgi:hypothetical protein